MKIVLYIVFGVLAGLIAYGFYINAGEPGAGEKFIGFGVLTFAFIFMPLFIYHRYNGKDLSRYSLRNLFEKRDNDHG